MFSLVEKTQGDLSTQRKAVELKLLLEHSVSTRMLAGTALLFACSVLVLISIWSSW